MVDAGVHAVLVGDRDSQARTSISDLVSSLGFRPEPARTGAEALAAVGHSHVALVLLSVDLVDPCGYEVLHRMRGRYGEKLPIALLSATDHSGPRDEVAPMLLGADDYFTKPLQPDLFVARVRRLVNR